MDVQFYPIQINITTFYRKYKITEVQTTKIQEDNSTLNINFYRIISLGSKAKVIYHQNINLIR